MRITVVVALALLLAAATVARATELYGTQGDDTLRGGPEADRITGADGDDVLSGEAGDDFVAAGNGRDWLDGGAGDDRLAMTQDGVWDRVICGDGRDVVSFTEFADRIAADCELLGDLSAENQVSARSRTVGRGVLAWRAICLCSGRLVVTTERGTVLGRSTRRDLRGAGRVLSVRIRRAQLDRLQGQGSVRVWVTIVNSKQPIRFPQRIRF